MSNHESFVHKFVIVLSEKLGANNIPDNQSYKVTLMLQFEIFITKMHF